MDSDRYEEMMEDLDSFMPNTMEEWEEYRAAKERRDEEM